MFCFFDNANFSKYFRAEWVKHGIKHLIIKPFDLLNTILLIRTKTLVNNMLTSKLLWMSSLEHKLRIFEIMILNTKWRDFKSRKNLCTKNFTYTDKSCVHEIAAVNLSKIYPLKNAKEICKPNNRGINRDWISNITVKPRGGISKFTVPGSSTPASILFFCCWIKISGLKERPALEKSYLFHELEDMKSWYCKNNHSR